MTMLPVTSVLSKVLPAPTPSCAYRTGRWIMLIWRLSRVATSSSWIVRLSCAPPVAAVGPIPLTRTSAATGGAEVEAVEDAVDRIPGGDLLGGLAEIGRDHARAGFPQRIGDVGRA